MEIDSVGPQTLQQVAVPGIAWVHDLIERQHLEIVSSLYWITPRDWSIATRTLADSLLFIPTTGAMTLTVAGRTLSLRPGQLGLIAEGLAHSAAYLGPSRRLQVYALHLRAHDASARQVFSCFRDHVLRLPSTGTWHRRMRELTAVLNRNRAAGRAIGRLMLLELMCELVFRGAAMREVTPSVEPRIADALAYLHAPGSDLRIEHLSGRAGISTVHFRSLFKTATGMTPKAYITRMQLAKASDLLRRSQVSVKTVAQECGYCSDHYFHQCFRRACGMTPSAYRARPPQAM